MTLPTTKPLTFTNPNKQQRKKNRTKKAPIPNQSKMSKPRLILLASLHLPLLLLLLHTHFPFCNALSLGDLNLLKSSEIDVITKRVCTKTIGECWAGPELDSETNRRILEMQKKYISYGTLKRDMVPCDKPGGSYYNCQGKPANPYNRGCEVITGCARGVKGVKT